MRSFIAIDLDEAIKSRIMERVDELQRRDFHIRYVKRENLHITLKFLGEIDEITVKKLGKMRMGPAFPGEFKISFSRIGYFGKGRRIRTVWVGVGSGLDKLNLLCNNINMYLKTMFRPDNISPHVTIGRVKSGRNSELLLEWLNENESVNIGEMAVKEFKLKKSTLTPEGPVYEDVHTWKLGGSAE